MKVPLKLNILVVILILSLALGNAIISSGCGGSDDDYEKVGSVTGTVTDTDGTILTGKEVELAGINGTIGIGIQTTNTSGQFSFVSIPVGIYTATVRETEEDDEGNKEFIASKNIEIVEKETTEVTIVRGEVAPPTPTPTITPTPTGTLTVTPTPTPTS